MPILLPIPDNQLLEQRVVLIEPLLVVVLQQSELRSELDHLRLLFDEAAVDLHGILMLHVVLWEQFLHVFGLLVAQLLYLVQLFVHFLKGSLDRFQFLVCAIKFEPGDPELLLAHDWLLVRHVGFTIINYI